MRAKVFTKRNPKLCKEVTLDIQIRNRILYLMKKHDPFLNGGWRSALFYYELPPKMMAEHGWSELRSYNMEGSWRGVDAEGFIKKGVARFVLDATEIYYDILTENHGCYDFEHPSNPIEYQRELNEIFEDAKLPWRMLDGRLIKLNSKWLEEEVISEVFELFGVEGFDGALEEFTKAVHEYSSGNYKEAIQKANLSFESTLKSILGVSKEKPGVLIRKIVDSGLIPDYHEGFLRSFEEHILIAIAKPRNEELGAGHGQGKEINEPPASLAELAINLTGVIIIYLIKRYNEKKPINFSK